jgi:hypothetical protein
MGFDPISAAIIGVTTLASGLMGSDAAHDASDAQVQASQQANNTQERIFQQQAALQEPFRQAGITGQNRLMQLLGLSGDQNSADYGKYARDFGMSDFQADPGYDFRFKEGLKALNNSMAAKGLGISGANIKGAQQYGQGLASQEYQNAFNRYQVNRSNQINPLQALAGQAQSSANTLTNAAGQMGQNISENQLQAGNARASGYIGSSNALTNALTGGVNAFTGLRNSSSNWNPYANGYQFGPQG